MWLRGFTLIELLLVISIIALLSTVTLSALQEARGRATDAAVRRYLTEMRVIMSKEFAETGSFQNLKDGGGAKAPGSVCVVGTGATQLKGQYAAEFKQVCDALIRLYRNSCDVTGAAGTCLRFNQPPASGAATRPRAYSMWAYLPEASRKSLPQENKYLCMGSNGQSSISDMVGAELAFDGCYNDTGLGD